MKKILVSVLAIAGLVACNNENVISEANNSQAITFGAFVENATRANDPSTTTTNIEEFSVWGYMNSEKGIVFNDELVSRSGDSWVYTNLQYWLPGNHYHFAAFAGDRTDVQGLPVEAAMGAEGLGTITFHNVEGTNDILYAQTDRYAEATATPINLQFAHLLSKVKFTFKNGFANPNNYVVVSDITMDVPAYGDLTLNKAAYDAKEYIWANHAETTTLQFGHMNNAAKLAIGGKETSDNERLTIPADADKEYTINFTVEVYNGEERGLVRDMEVKLTGFEFVAGRAYNLVATINQENLDLNAIEFQVVVDEWIEQEVDGGAVEGEVRFVSTIAELQAALDAAQGDLSVVLGADLAGNVTVPEIANATIAINGNGHNFDGCFLINGKSTYANATTVFENINFATADNSAFTGSGDAFIYCGEHNGTNLRYPDNVTVKNCTFAGTESVVGIKFWSLNGNIVVENCQADGMHSLMQLTSCGKADVLVDNATVSNCKNGISLQYAGNNVIRNSNIVAREYGIRADGCAATTTIENTTIEAKQPVIVRKVTTAGYVLNLDAASVLTTAEAFQVIFTKNSDDAEYVAPTVDFTFNGPATTAVFPGFAADAVVANNTDELNAAIAAKAANIVLVGGETYTGAFKLNYAANITAKGGKAIIAGRFDVNNTATGSSFANLKFEITADSKVKNVWTGAPYQYPSTVNIQQAAVSFENCEFATSLAAGVCGINYGNADTSVLKVNNCSFVGDFYAIRSRTNLEVTNCTFDIYTTQGTLAAVWSWGTNGDYNPTVTFVNNKNLNANKIYSVQMTASNYTYKNLVVNVQKNDNFLALADGVYTARGFAGTTFVAGSEEFEF